MSQAPELSAIALDLNELKIYMKAIAASSPPNWIRPLKAFNNFNWASIGAKSLDADKWGATKVAWAGHVYTRRCGQQPKFGAAIWYSRSNGNGSDGETSYVRLITFKDNFVDVEPVPEYIAKRLG